MIVSPPAGMAMATNGEKEAAFMCGIKWVRFGSWLHQKPTLVTTRQYR